MPPDELEAALRDIGARRYHRLHPFHRAAARRQVHEGSGAGLGAQPLLLPGDDPGEGREPDRALRGSGAAPGMAQPPRRSRRRARRRRRHRALAQAHRRARARPRLCRLARRAAPGDALCGRGLCAFRPREDAARGRRLLAHRAVLAADHRRAGRGHAQELRFRQRRHAGLFLQAPPQAQRDSDFALDYVKRHARTPEPQQAVLRGARIQMRRAVGDAGRALPCLCGAQACSARRLRAEGSEHR